MLHNLTINNIVLIDHLELEGANGLCALTGETGAGKSILLDALGLALGGRSESKLVRHGADKASVTACFDLPADHASLKFLRRKDIDTTDGLILRRAVGKDGRSKAFINDAPVSVQLLKEVGNFLVEIHGQFETQGLLNPETHLSVIDGYAEINKQVADLKAAYQSWRAVGEALAQAKEDIEIAKQQEEYLRYAVDELEKLSPEIGEEDLLADKRKHLMNREKITEAFEHADDLLDNEQGLLNLIGKLQGVIEKTDIDELIQTAENAKNELTELSYQIEEFKSGYNEGDNLEEIENRYFALKDCARKHNCLVDELPAMYEKLLKKLRLITHQEDSLQSLEIEVEKNRQIFIDKAKLVSKKRHAVAGKLEQAVNAELPYLKMEKAKFVVEITSSDDDNDWNMNGCDKVRFLVSTNPQTPAGAINKIASGGELARFMLALKVVIAETGTIPTLIFDEVDSGIGGATADAVGEKLARLSDKYQVLVVTHSPQVAARASSHWTISKHETKGAVTTTITPLETYDARQEEIARMLSGAEITSEARAAAAKLLG